jgi:hypothetical protein
MRPGIFDNDRSISQADERNHQVTLPSLPCYPCPHGSSCCAYGTTLSDEEAAAIEADYGPGLVYQTHWGEWRTRVQKKRCVLYRDGGCTIHDKLYYPTTCREFPWIDAETGGRYEYDVTICGEFEESPELVAIQRAIPRAVRRRGAA